MMFLALFYEQFCGAAVGQNFLSQDAQDVAVLHSERFYYFWVSHCVQYPSSSLNSLPELLKLG